MCSFDLTSPTHRWWSYASSHLCEYNSYSEVVSAIVPHIKSLTGNMVPLIHIAISFSLICVLLLINLKGCRKCHNYLYYRAPLKIHIAHQLIVRHPTYVCIYSCCCCSQEGSCPCEPMLDALHYNINRQRFSPCTQVRPCKHSISAFTSNSCSTMCTIDLYMCMYVYYSLHVL